MTLKKLSCVSFAGVDSLDDVKNHTYNELFVSGGFVVSDESVLNPESITTGRCDASGSFRTQILTFQYQRGPILTTVKDQIFQFLWCWELQLIQSLSQLSDFLEQYMDGEILSSVCITLCSYVCGTFYSLLLHPQICYIYFFFIWNWVVDEVTIFLKYFSKAEHVWLRSAFKYHCWAPEVQNSSSVLWYCCWPICLEENLKWVAAVCNCVTVL